MYKKFFFLLLQFSFIALWAQEVPIGQFKEYLPYNRFHSIAQDRENIYVATNQSILVVDKGDTSKVKWSNLNGLSDVGIQTMYADPKGRLIIAYNNSNLDVITYSGAYKVNNIRDILNKQITGSKTINKIAVLGDLAYLTCDFGVVIINLKTLLVKETWFTVRNNEFYRVLAFAEHDEHYYLATDKGVFSLPSTALNPADFSSWKLENELSKSPYKLLCSYSDKLFAVKDGGSAEDSLFVYEDSQWKNENILKMSYYRSFEIINNKLLVCSWNHVKVFFEELGHYSSFYWEPKPPAVWQNGACAILDEKMDVWVADNTSGLIYLNTKTGKQKNISEDGPANSNAYGLCFNDGILAVVPGNRNSAIVPSWTSPAISILADNSWWYHISFSQYKYAAGFNSVVINPLNKNEIYMASWIGGLFRINKETANIIHYNGDNSPLISDRPDGYIFVAGLAIDKNHNLWMTQSGTTNLLKVKDLKAEGEEWYSFNVGISGSSILAEHILVDSRNYKWVTIPRTNQLFVFSENGGSLANTAAHKRAEPDLTSQAKVAGARITCIAEDRDGRIWTGADQGIKVIYDAASVFDRKVYAKNILIEQRIGDTAYTQILFENEYITCIAVDAADRKWIGTRNAGVFLISPNGTQELLHFTTENSPLFSNQINDIKINPENGEVFFATEGGLLSYKGTATVGKENYKEVLVYPNPVHEGYTGPIAVRGLMEDSFCKITDAAGNLVWQGYAYGGQLIWNGKDFYGKRPATGVYFVMASSKTGKEKKVAKFLFIQ